MKNTNGGRPPFARYPATRRLGGQPWIHVAAAAHRLAVTNGRIYQILRTGRFTAQVVEGITYIREKDVRDYRRYQQEIRRVREMARVAS